MNENFKSIRRQVYSAETVIKKSRFLAFACGVPDVGQANFFIARIAKEHYGATHNCYAYSVSGMQKFSDSGEPQGTAGIPILECIKSKGLSNVAVAVVRYFGGVKLGAGGLARAYRQSAAAVLDKAEKTEFKLCRRAEFTVTYQQAGLLDSAIRKYAREVQTEYGGSVKFIVTVESEKFSGFEAAFTELTQGGARIIEAGEILSELACL